MTLFLDALLNVSTWMKTWVLMNPWTNTSSTCLNIRQAGAQKRKTPTTQRAASMLITWEISADHLSSSSIHLKNARLLPMELVGRSALKDSNVIKLTQLLNVCTTQTNIRESNAINIDVTSLKYVHSTITKKTETQLLRHVATIEKAQNQLNYQRLTTYKKILQGTSLL